LTRAFIGLGANLGDRHVALERAVELLDAVEGVRVVAVSSFRETEPVGYVDQPTFLNGAVEAETDFDAPTLLEHVLGIERALGRTRGDWRFGPRTIDLDLLLFGDRVVDEPGVTVPHPRLHERRFVLEPLAELDPDLVVPGRGRVSSLLAELD